MQEAVDRYANADNVIFVDEKTTMEARAMAAYLKYLMDITPGAGTTDICEIEDRHINKPFKPGCIVYNFGDEYLEDEELESASWIVMNEFKPPVIEECLDALHGTEYAGHTPNALRFLFDERPSEWAEALRLGLRVVDTDPVREYQFWKNLFTSDGQDGYNTEQQLGNMGRIIRIDRGVRTQKATFNGRMFDDYFLIDTFDPCWDTLKEEAMHLHVRYVAVAETQSHMGLTRIYVQSLDEAGEDWDALKKKWPHARWIGNTMLLETPTGTNIERIRDDIPRYNPLPDNKEEVTKITPTMSCTLEVGPPDNQEPQTK